MSEITAKMVADLRSLTGLGMMDCKKALVETAGDIKAAEELLRVKSGAKAGKMAGRIAAEGSIVMQLTPDAKAGVIVEINCETDFVAKDDSFLSFANNVAKTILNNKPNTIEELNSMQNAEGISVEDSRKNIIAKLGENISIRRFKLWQAQGVLATYAHGQKIGVILDLVGGDAELGRNIAMHIAAMKPSCVSKDEVSSEQVEQERKIYTQQASESGKPAEIIAKMVEGRVNKYLAEITLLGQPYVKEAELTVEKLLAKNNAKVAGFTMYVVGEGIEKKSVDFATEVAQAMGN